MEAEKKFQTLQEEIRLLKGELKQSLVSVRDYLLNMELPSSEFSTILAALGGDEGQKMVMKGSLSTPELPEHDDEVTEMEEEEEEAPENINDQIPEDEEITDSEDVEEVSPENQDSTEEDTSAVDETREDEINPEDVLSPEENEEDSIEDNPGEPDNNQSHEVETEEMPMDYDKTSQSDIASRIPKVNMLANLLNWVARVRKDIGPEQIPVFLEVYGLSGYLSPELKEVIVHLAEMTEAHNEPASYAEIWSNSMLSLHGILTGGDIPLHPVIPVSKDTKQDIHPVEEEIIEVDKPVEKSAKLKLVLPDRDGNGQEFCIDLTPETERIITKNSRSA